MLFAALIAPDVARADTGEQAIALGRAGLDQYSAQKFTECAETFKQAQTLAPSIVFELYEARCLRGAGQYLAARARMKRVAETVVAEDAPGPWRQAALDAKVELPQLDKLVPSILVDVKGATGEGLILRVDGVDAKPGATVEVDPGKHTVTAVFGPETRKAEVEVADAQKGLMVTLDFGSPGSGEPPPPPPKEGSGGPGVVPGAVLTAVGGAAVLTGAVLGGLALSAYGDLEGCGLGAADELVCDPGITPDTDTFDMANTFADASTGLLIAGGVTLAVGVVLMIALPGDEAQAALVPGGFRF